jgi:AraC-like DNA-binding protein
MKEQARYWHTLEFNRLELLRATYHTHRFDRHVHEGYAIGIILRGVERFYYRGAMHSASPGSVIVINPDEIHDGHAAQPARGWSYRVFYPSVELMQQIAYQLSGQRQPFTGTPHFPQPIMHDPDLAALLIDAHAAQEFASSPLERQSRLYLAFGLLLERHASNRITANSTGVTQQTLERARRHLEDHFSEPVTLDDLAAFAGFSPFHLMRVFRDRFGMSPHRYLTYVRVKHAKTLLSNGLPIREVAQASGFTDQSHLTRRFKGVVGVTPGQYLQTISQ